MCCRWYSCQDMLCASVLCKGLLGTFCQSQEGLDNNPGSPAAATCRCCKHMLGACCCLLIVPKVAAAAAGICCCHCNRCPAATAGAMPPTQPMAGMPASSKVNVMLQLITTLGTGDPSQGHAAALTSMLELARSAAAVQARSKGGCHCWSCTQAKAMQ